MDKSVDMEQMYKAFFDAVGIVFSDNLEDFYNDDRDKYIKVDDSMMAQVDLLLGEIPHLLTEIGIKQGKDLYKVIIDKAGRLQDSAKYPGWFTGNIIKTGGANNEIIGGAVFQPADMALKAPQVISNVFSVMSIVTGQYYMSQINTRMSSIDKGIESVQQFIENDKRAKLEADSLFLKRIQENLIYIRNDEVYKKSTIENIQQIERNADADIIFYKMQINELKNLKAEEDKSETVLENVKRFYSNISGYWFALYLSCFSVYLDLIVAECLDENYIQYMKKELTKKCESFRNDYDMWKATLDEYLSQAKGFDEDKVLKLLRKAKDVKIYPYAMLVGYIADKMADDDNEKKKMQKLETEEVVKLIENLENTGAMEGIKTDLEMYSLISKGSVEVVKNTDGVYFKVIEGAWTDEREYA